jgi:AraC family transcriptional regulator
MKIHFVVSNPIQLVGIRHRGPYDQLPPIFQQLDAWTRQVGLSTMRSIGVFYDNPDYVSAGSLRSIAAFEIDNNAIVPSNQLGAKKFTLAGMDYATTRYVGPYDQIEPVWSVFTQILEGQYSRRISKQPAFEVYVNDPALTAPNDLITDLYMPVD